MSRALSLPANPGNDDPSYKNVRTLTLRRNEDSKSKLKVTPFAVCNIFVIFSPIVHIASLCESEAVKAKLPITLIAGVSGVRALSRAIF